MALPLSFMVLHDENQAEALDLRNAFTDMTRMEAKHWPASQAALLIAQDEDDVESITEVGVVTRSRQRVATGWHRLRYVRRLQITPVPLGALIAQVPARHRAVVRGRASTGGVLTHKGTTAVVDALEQVASDAATALRRLLNEDGSGARKLTGDGLQAAVQEADAVRLALDIADVPRDAMRGLRPDGEMSFLEQLEAVRASEDTSVAYDGMRFLDFDRIENPSGAVRFAKGHERLTIVNVNRQPLERTTGADLIYINETHPSFVLVQYKAMRREGDERSELVYRPDAQLKEELARMRKLKVGADDDSPAGFRLSPVSCYIKLYKPVARLDRTQDLVSGMYLPLDYYDALVASDDVRGPRGGVVISYSTVTRHISNDLFVGLVRGGWIGSRGATTKRLEKLVLAGLDAGRSVTVAAKSRAARSRFTDR